jgi:glucosyl-3-phosphoglycerate synthase
VGHNDYLEFIDSFLYPLAGEFSFRKGVLSDLRIPSDWGLEIGVLSEMHRNYASNRVCQVDIADAYDHKHQDLSLHNIDGGLSKMSIDISKALIRKLATQGETFSTESIRTLKATYYRIALDYLEMYRADTLMNGLNLDIHNEEKAIEMFAENVMIAGQIFLDKPMDTPFIPSWNRVISAMPGVLEQLKEAVELDNQEFSE